MTSLRGAATNSELLARPLEELAAAAFATARAAHGYVVTYSPKVFIPLTKLCRDRCGYCTFAQAPAHVESPYMGLDEVMAVAQAGRDAGCTEALFTLGERPELRYDEAARWLAARGYESTVDYVANAAQMVLESTGLLPHANAGALYRHELAQLRTVAASQGMMIEALADLAAHRLAPDKEPAAPPRHACASPESCRSPSRPDCSSASARRGPNVSRRSRRSPSLTRSSDTSKR